MRFTLKEVLDFCWNHRGRHGFKNWTYEQAAEVVIQAATKDKLLTVEEHGELCGAAIYSLAPERVLFVHHIFAVNKGIDALISYARKCFPRYTIIGTKRGRTAVFNFNTSKNYGRRSSNN